VTRRPLAQAVAAAERVLGMLRDGCERIEIAGSIRRGATDAKDIEIVAVAKFQPDLFGGQGFDLLNETVRLRVREKRMQWRTPKGMMGAPEPKDLEDRKYYALGTVEPGTVEPWAIDLFCVRPPAQWGAIFAIRTGPAEYAQRLVTAAHARQMRCQDGRLVSIALATNGVERMTPEERDFIEACGMPYIAPNLRR